MGMRPWGARKHAGNCGAASRSGVAPKHNFAGPGSTARSACVPSAHEWFTIACVFGVAPVRERRVHTAVQRASNAGWSTAWILQRRSILLGAERKPGCR